MNSQNTQYIECALWQNKCIKQIRRTLEGSSFGVSERETSFSGAYWLYWTFSILTEQTMQLNDAVVVSNTFSNSTFKHLAGTSQWMNAFMAWRYENRRRNERNAHRTHTFLVRIIKTKRYSTTSPYTRDTPTLTSTSQVLRGEKRIFVIASVGHCCLYVLCCVSRSCSFATA